MRTSIIISTYEKQLADIDPETLGYQDKAAYTSVKNLLKYLKSVKVIDAPILLKIYKLYA